MSTAGRLFTRLASTAATTVTPTTKARNGTAAADSSEPGVARRPRTAGTASATTPIAATTAGSRCTNEAAPNPARVRTSTTTGYTGSRGSVSSTSGPPAAAGAAGCRRSVAKKRRNTAYSTASATTHGVAISADFRAGVLTP